ncbi:unnamed protein product [Camellia sinensis]
MGYDAIPKEVLDLDAKKGYDDIPKEVLDPDAKKKQRRIARIDCPKSRNICFTKCCQSLFKKAVELFCLHIAGVTFFPVGTPSDLAATLSKLNWHPMNVSKINLSDLKKYATNLEKLKSYLLMSPKEMKSKRDNSWRGDDEEVEFTFEELMSDDLDVVVQSSEAAKNNEEYEAM